MPADLVQSKISSIHGRVSEAQMEEVIAAANQQLGPKEKALIRDFLQDTLENRNGLTTGGGPLSVRPRDFAQKWLAAHPNDMLQSGGSLAHGRDTMSLGADVAIDKTVGNVVGAGVGIAVGAGGVWAGAEAGLIAGAWAGPPGMLVGAGLGALAGWFVGGWVGTGYALSGSGKKDPDQE